MSSRSHCAVDIIANCIDVGTKQHGGQRSALSLSGWQTLCGARHIRSRDLGFALEPVLIRARAKGGRPWSGLVRRFGMHHSGQGSSRTRQSREVARCYYLLGRNEVKREPEH